MTSPGEPCASSGQAEGLRARTKWPGGAQGGAAGPGPAALGDAGTRVRLGLCAAASASLALQVPVTHSTRARPSRSLTRSPAAAAAQAKPTSAHRPKGQRTSLSGTRGQRVGRSGEAKNLEISAHSRPGRPGEPAPTAPAAPGAQVGGGDRASRAEEVRAGGDWSPGEAQPASLQSPSPLLFPSRMPSSHSRVMSLTHRGRPRMCPRSSYVSGDQLFLVAPGTLAKTPCLRRDFASTELDLAGAGRVCGNRENLKWSLAT